MSFLRVLWSNSSFSLFRVFGVFRGSQQPSLLKSAQTLAVSITQTHHQLWCILAILARGGGLRVVLHQSFPEGVLDEFDAVVET